MKKRNYGYIREAKGPGRGIFKGSIAIDFAYGRWASDGLLKADIALRVSGVLDIPKSIKC